jgi:hypothetical protein
MPAFRIFNSVLGDHLWAADGRLCIAQQPQSDSFQEASPKAEINALFSRLVLRSKSDRILCRAAKRLHADPSISLGQLAPELGVSERYLLSGLRAILGVDPQSFLRQATSLSRTNRPPNDQPDRKRRGEPRAGYARQDRGRPRGASARAIGGMNEAAN